MFVTDSCISYPIYGIFIITNIQNTNENHQQKTSSI